MNAESQKPAVAAVTEPEKNAIIIGVLSAMLLAALDQMIVAPAMPTIGAALGHASYLPWIVTAYLITATATAPLYGKFSDVFGRRPVIIAAVLIFLLGSLISAIAPSMLVLILGRAIQGLGGGGLFALAQTVIGDLAPPRERARYSVWISSTWAIASIAGPVLGGYFAEHLHWSLIFWINFPIALIALLILNEPLKKLAAPTRRHRIDIAAAMILIAATSLLMLALNWGGHAYAWFSAPIASLFGGSLILWILFGVRLLNASEPLISLKSLGNPIVLIAASASFMAQFAFVGASIFLPVFLQRRLGLAVDQSGLALLGMLIGTVIGAALAGQLMPRLAHYKRVALGGSLTALLCFLGLAAVADTRSLLLVELLTTGGGIGVGAMFPVLSISVQNAVGRSELGVATGVNIFLRSLGGAIGVAVLGAIALSYGLPLAREGAGPIAASDAATASSVYQALFLTSAAALLAALALLIAMPEKPLEGRADRSA